MKVRSLNINLVVLVSLWLFAINSVADHFPPGMQNHGAAEQTLSGIHIQGHVSEAVAKYGPPTRVQERKSKDYPPGSGVRDYIWEQPSVSLDVTTGYYTDAKTNAEVESGILSIDSQGKAPSNDMGKTAAGLALGDSAEKITAVYGPRFFRYKLPNGLVRIMIQWEDETTLTVYLKERSKRICRIILEASVE